jgi:uncharacterized protein YbjQ (UPF0145 family)
MSMEKNIIITTTENLPAGRITEVLGVVKGNTIRARHLGSDIGAGLKSLIGGEIRGYVKALTAAREEAEARMLEEAHTLGADAVVCVRYSTAQVITGAAEILVYGTAVRTQKL